MQKISAQPDPYCALLNAELEKEQAIGRLSARFGRLTILLALHVDSKKTPNDGWKATLLAGRLGIPAPTWAIELLEQAEHDALRGTDAKGEKIDIATALGFKGRGKGGQKNAPVQRAVQENLHEHLCLSVQMLVAFGEPFLSACEMVAKQLKATPDWNDTVYPLRAPNPESLAGIYREWEQERGDEVLSIYAKGFAAIPDEVRQLFLKKFRS